MKQLDVFSIQHVEIDFNKHKITSNGVPLKIDLKAFEALKLMISKQGKVVEIDQFMSHVWSDKPSSHEVVTSAIARLRKTLKKSGITDEVIETVHKVGYRINPKHYDVPATTNKPLPQRKNNALTIALLSILTFSLLLNLWQWLNPKKPYSYSKDNAATEQTLTAKSLTQIFFLRHAEKMDSNSDNPPLSPVGIKHADYWKKVLQHMKFDKIYSTDFVRNITTAQILSEPGQEIISYSPMSFEINRFIQQIEGQKILIIGHSNTIPDMVNRLIGTVKYPPMSHENYNQLYQVTIGKNGDTSSTLLHIEMPSAGETEAF